MLLVNLFILLLIPLIFGLLLLSLFIRKSCEYLFFWEKLAVSFAIGLGFLTIIMFVLGFARIPITFFNTLITVLLLSGLISLYLVKIKSFCISSTEAKNAFKTSEKFTVFEYILVLLISLKTIFVFFATLIKPVVDVDAFQQYTIVAKGVFYSKTFLTPYLGNFGIDKPLFTFLSQAWVFLGLHTINDALVKVLTPILFVCFLIIFYAALRRYYARVYGLLFTFLLSTLPFIVYHATTAYSDFPMTFYYATATIYLFLFMKDFPQNKDRSFVNITISFALLAIAVWAKRAGIVLSGVNIVMLMVYLTTQRKDIQKPDFKKLAIGFIIFMLAISPWIAYGQTGMFVKVFKSLVKTEQVAPADTAIAEVAPDPTTLPKTNVIFSTFLRKNFLYADWHLTWLLLLIALIFFYKRSFGLPHALLLAIIFLDITAVFVQFSTGEQFKWLLDGTLLDRLVMNEVPIILYFCAEAILPSMTKS